MPGAFRSGIFLEKGTKTVAPDRGCGYLFQEVGQKLLKMKLSLPRIIQKAVWWFPILFFLYGGATGVRTEDVRQGGSPPAEPLFQKGQQFFFEGRLQSAVTAYEEALQRNPDHAFARNNLGYIYYLLDRLPEALECFEQAVKSDPQLLIGYMNLGNVHYRLRDYMKALSSYRRAIEIDPEHIHAYFNAGNAGFRLGHYSLAVTYYERALRLDESYSNIHFNLALALRRLGRLNRAKNRFQLVLKLNPRLASAHYELGKLLEKSGENESALRSFRRACDLGRQAACRKLRGFRTTQWSPLPAAGFPPTVVRESGGPDNRLPDPPRSSPESPTSR